INILRQLEPPKLFNPLDVRVAQLNPLGKGQEQPGLNPLAKGGQELGNPLPGGSSGSQNPLPGVGAPGASPTDPAVGLIAPKLELGPDADAPREAVEHWSKRWNWCIKAQETPDSEVAKPPAKKAVTIPAHFASLPALHDPWRLPVVDLHNPNVAFAGRTDNSNTQFAILALWAARRHDVPMIRTLNLITKRYITSQNGDGTWDYHYHFGGAATTRDSDAMTCVGLLGLAVGHGLARDPVLNLVPDRQKVAQDPRIVHGFAALGRRIGMPTGQWDKLPMQNLYFLWSVERVGMLYDLPTIGDKDWYRWGAEVLVANQRPQGHWDGGGYHGATPVIDTCLALLFLKRANFAKDLTNVLPFNPRDLSERISQMNPVQKETPKEQSKSQSPPPQAEANSP